MRGWLTTRWLFRVCLDLLLLVCLILSTRAFPRPILWTHTFFSFFDEKRDEQLWRHGDRRPSVAAQNNDTFNLPNRGSSFLPFTLSNSPPWFPRRSSGYTTPDHLSARKAVFERTLEENLAVTGVVSSLCLAATAAEVSAVRRLLLVLLFDDTKDAPFRR